MIQINNETELAKPIFLTMRGTSTSGLNAHVIVYGVSEWSDYVSPYVYGIISKNDGGDDGSFLKIDGSRAMTGDLDVNTNKIINLKTPTNESDAANKKYIDETLEQSHLLASSKKNEFLYLDSPDDTSSEYNIVVKGFVNNFRESPHRNKKVYDITLKRILDQIIIDQGLVLIYIHNLLVHIR